MVYERILPPCPGKDCVSPLHRPIPLLSRPDPRNHAQHLALASEEQMSAFISLSLAGVYRGLTGPVAFGGIELGSHSCPSAPLMKRLACSIQVQLFIPVQSPSRTCSS